MKQIMTVYENKWCKIVNEGTIYVLKSKSGKYNDQYFQSLDQVLRYIGVRYTSYDGKVITV